MIFLVLQRVAGKDASKQFWKYHNDSILKKYQKQLQVGSLDSKKAAAAGPPTPPATPPPPPAEKKEKVVPSAEPGAVAPAPGPGANEEAEALDPYGALIPFADPSWYQSVGLEATIYHRRRSGWADRGNSITLLTSTSPTQPLETRSVNGLKARWSRT